MVMKTYLKTIARSVKGNLAKFISLTVIMLLGIAFVAGLGTLTPTIKDSFNDEMNKANFSDIIIKAKTEQGFTAKQISEIEALDYIETAESVSAVDMEDDGVKTRVYVFSSFDTELNKMEIEGDLPDAAGEVLVERHSNETTEYNIGDEITVMGMPCKVVGIVSNPLIFDRSGEPSLIDEEYLERIVYFSKDYFPVSLPTTDIYVRLSGLGEREYFSEDYLTESKNYVEKLKNDLREDFAYLTVEENKSYVVLDMYCEKVTIITLVFPAFFIAVAALVVMTTMTRMIEEERLQIGCMKSLGASDGKIIFKYVSLAFVCCLIAVVVGLLVGLAVLPRVIYPAFNVIFFMPPSSGKLYPLYGIISFVFMAVVVLTVTITVCKNRLREQPAALLTGKAPKPGKRILLERWNFIWKRLSFKYKSSIRNVFRYKKHLVMTVFSVAGATALAFAGFALLNVADALIGGSFAGLKDSVKPISIVIIIFALLLCGFVIYNLTNLNIGERKKEIATLGVLGYHDKEILGYIYREIMMMTVIGDIFGIGLGCLLVDTVLRYLEFGSLADARWYAYVLSFSLIICFVGITDLLLSKKILSIDMTTSLKAND